jgi:hypothetical protein
LLHRSGSSTYHRGRSPRTIPQTARRLFVTATLVSHSNGFSPNPRTTTNVNSTFRGSRTPARKTTG